MSDWKAMAAAVFAGFILVSAASPALTTRTIVNGPDPLSLDPAYARSESERRVVAALYEGLVELDPRTGEAKPGLAERWVLGSDGRSYRFFLRPASWSDGKPITAQTVVDSWLRELDPQTNAADADLMANLVQGAGDFHAGKGKSSDVAISAVDEHTFQVTFSRPIVSMSVLAQPAFVPVPLHALSTTRDKAGRVVSGPFRIDSWVAQDRMILVPNETYWDAAAVGALRLVLLATDDADWGADLFRRGDADADLWLSAAQPNRGVPRADRRTRPLLAVEYLRLNTNDPTVSDVRVRRALALALDRDNLVPDSRPAYSLCPPFPGYTPPVFAKHGDRALARKLLDQAGHPGTIILLAPNRAVTLARAVRDQWRDLGVDCDVRVEAKDAFDNDVAAGRFSAALEGWEADDLDPLPFLELFRARDAWQNDAYDKALDDAQAATGTVRKAALVRAERVLWTDFPVIPLVFPSDTVWIRASRWVGWTDNPLVTVPWKNLRSR